MKKYFFMFILGLLATFSFIFTIWADEETDIVLNIIAMIGSGIFCSALVSLIIEQSNKKRELQRKQDEQKFILSSVKDILISITKSELRYLSEYVLFENNSAKTIKRDLSFPLQIKNVTKYLTDIINSLYKNTSVVIDENYLKKQKRKRDLAYGMLLPYYRTLNHSLLKVIEDSPFYYINGNLSEDTIKALKKIQQNIDDIITYSSEETIDLLFEFKKIFFEHISPIVKVLGINENEFYPCNILQ